MLCAMYSRRLAATAVAYVVLHHLGLVPDGFGDGPRGTRWADWLDLFIPWVFLGLAAATLAADRAGRTTWTVFGAGAVAYASGHGIHLAANSVGNVDPGETAHLWDEVVGHEIWFAGVALVLAAVARTMVGRPRPGPLGHLLGLAVGLTWVTNAVGGGTPALSLTVAVAAAAWGWRHRRDLGVVLLTGFLPAAVLLVVGIGVGVDWGG
jgi:hypothetical protein